MRLTAKASSDTEVDGLLAAEEAEVRAILGDLIFGVDDETMEATVLAQLAAAGLTLAVAESVTGGMIASRLCAVPGASAVFRGGVVAYASEVKFDLLDVPTGPVVSAEAACAMADGVRRRLGADVGLSTTGVAGPTEQEGIAVGTVYVGVAVGERVEAVALKLPGDRERIRAFATISASDALRMVLRERSS